LQLRHWSEGRIVTEDEGWPRGTTGELSPVHAAVISGAALALIALVVAAGFVAALLIVQAIA
jgi:hypothetical protein